ncbi:Uncharacterized protein PBTT_09205 [Plasmodiophora brassicae]
MCAELVDPSSPLFSGFRSIHLKYPEVGHTFLICDRIFSTIARKAKQIRIYDPKNWVTAINQFYMGRPNPHRAKWMDRLDFLNYAEHLEPGAPCWAAAPLIQPSPCRSRLYGGSTSARSSTSAIPARCGPRPR